MTDIELIISGVAFVAWLIRLEAKVLAAEKDNTKLETEVELLRSKHEALDSKVLEKIAQLREDIAEIKGLIAANRHNE